jgi:hypothetical protein
VWVHHYNWDRPREGLGGLCPIDRVCKRIDKTKERIHVREYVVVISLRKLK